MSIVNLYKYAYPKVVNPEGSRAFIKILARKFAMSMSRSSGNAIHKNKWLCLMQYLYHNIPLESRTKFLDILRFESQKKSTRRPIGVLRAEFCYDLISLGMSAGPTAVDSDGDSDQSYYVLAHKWEPIMKEAGESSYAWFMNWLLSESIVKQNCGHYEFHDYRVRLDGDENNYQTPSVTNHCRACARAAMDSGIRKSTREGSLILTIFARTIFSRGEESYIADYRNPRFTFNERRQLWHDEYWTEYANILGSYHSSKQKGFSLIKSPWFSQNRRAFGLELEVQNRSGDTLAKLGKIHEALNHETFNTGEYCFFERDGSIGEGFEIVTQPAGIDVHKERLHAFLNAPQLKMGLRSHEGGACGLHIHVGREYLTQGQIYRVQSFLNDVRNESLVRAIARRYDNNYCKFKPQLAKFTIKNKHSTERYEALNVTNTATIEFRIFRGSLRYESVIAALEFVNAVLTFCTPGEVSLTEFTALGFKRWLMRFDHKTDTKFLRSYLSMDTEHDQEQPVQAAA